MIDVKCSTSYRTSFAASSHSLSPSMAPSSWPCMPTKVSIETNANYTWHMFEIRTTPVFDSWFSQLRDRTVRIRVQVRIDRLEAGNPGKYRRLGSRMA